MKTGNELFDKYSYIPSLRNKSLNFIEYLVLDGAKKIINSDNNTLIKEGRKWVIKTYEEWADDFYFLPKLFVVRAIKNLVKNGNMECKCKWYTVRES